MYGNYARFLMNQASARREQERAAWMQTYQAEVLAVQPELAGRINWGNADVHYRNGRGAVEAARREVESGLAGRV